MQQTKTLLAASALFSLTTLTAEASLSAGIADGKSVVYSSISNITWTGDANLLGSMIQNQGYSTVVNAIIAASPTITDTPNYYDGSYGNYDGANGRSYSGVYSLSSGDFDSTNLGRTSWFGAQAFTDYLNSINYAGSNQWALPSAGANPQIGYNPTSSQFGELYYNELGGTFSNTSSFFTNQQSHRYWLGSEYGTNPRFAWFLSTVSGNQFLLSKIDQDYAWAVSPGNIAAVPVPATAWLFGSGLMALVGWRRRGKP